MVDFPITFEFEGEKLSIVDTKYYEGNRIALQIVDMECQPFAVLTVNIPEVRLDEGEFIVKTWAENEDIVNHIRTLGLFEETAKRVRTGFCVAEIWKLKQ